MPLASKRRKVEGITGEPWAKPTNQRGIHAFGKISKSKPPISGKANHEKESIAYGIIGKSDVSVRVGEKRKLVPIEGNLDTQRSETGSKPSEQPLLPEDGNNSNGTSGDIGCNRGPSCFGACPVTLYKRAPLLPKTTETTTRGASSRLQSLAPPSLSPSTRNTSPIAAQHATPPSSPAASKPRSIAGCDHSTVLPDELQDLVNLHSSFLTALSLHYAHNGSMTPADLRNLSPAVERAWRKRRVVTEDVRRILALERSQNQNQEKSGLLYLSDYGCGKVCVEISDSCHSEKAQKAPVNEEALNTIFLQNLIQQWKTYKSSQRTDTSPETFIDSLPLQLIIPCASLSKLAPLFSKGQRRLEDLKAGAIKAQQRPLSTVSANLATSPQLKPKKPPTRSADLLSRIKAKQLHQSTLPLPPSTEALARKSALQRLPEVAPVLESLSVASKKHANDDVAVAEMFKSKVAHASFTLPTLVQHLQMSLRNPIGKEEAIRCVRLLAEVAPEWVGVREVGKMVGVTVRGEGVDRREMGRRIEGLVERL